MGAHATSGLRVLVVDDDTLVAESLAEFLAAEGYRTLTAASLAEARTTLATAAAEADEGRDAPIGVAIVDVGLPGGSGLDLLREIVRSGRGTAVVMLTGYGTVESAVEALRHGAVDFLTKPAAEGELRVSLERAVRMTVYLTDLAHFARVNEVMARYLREPYPARVAIGVASLPRGALVEIDAILYAG